MRKLLILLALMLLIPVVHASGIAFKDIAVEVDGEPDDNINYAGGSFEAAPGDSIELTVEVENDYPSTTDNHKIKHIDVSIDVDTFCSRDLDDSIEEKIRIDDLDPDSDDQAVFRFQVPDCANEGNYDIEIQVDGTDQDDTEYSIEETVNVGVDKDASDIIMDFSLDSAMSCTDREFSVSVEAHNIGSTDDDAGLLLINDDLGVNKFEFMDLRTGSWTNEDTQFLKTFTFTLDDSVEPGDYDLRAEVEYGSNSKELKRWLTITVPECTEDAFEEQEEETPVEETEEPQTTTTVVIPETTPTTSTKDTDLFSVPLLIGALVAGMIILAVMIIFLVKKQ